MKFMRVYLWFTTITMCIFIPFVPMAAKGASASSQEITTQWILYSNTSLLQTTPTPTATTLTSAFTTTFKALEYDEVTLASPVGQVKYNFRLPYNWQVQGGYIDFDLSYNFSLLDNSLSLPATFGDLTIMVDDQTVEIYTIEEPTLENYRLRVPIPASIFTDAGRVQHEIKATLDATSTCIVSHKAALVFHPTSSLSLDYNLNPLTLDLSSYPVPFYQNTFEPDEVVFALPAHPSPAEAAGAVAIAAKLGNLTVNRTTISSTFDLDLAKTLSSASSTFNQHLFVIGQPQDNKLLPLLNSLVDLPVKLQERQMSLLTQAPASVEAGQTFTYTFTITNTSKRSADLLLTDTLPAFTQFLTCEPRCATDKATKLITWNNLTLAPNTVKKLSLTLKVSEVITSAQLQNNIVLTEVNQGPINIDTFVSDLNSDRAKDGEEKPSAASEESNYFFTMGDKAVAENDGIIQLIASPWNENRAILIITGLNNSAVEKASQAMSSEAHFPGMKGSVALVKDVSPPIADQINTVTATELTFQDLGYEDEIVRGGFGLKINYTFFIPLGWQLNDQASLNFYFTHSQALEALAPGLTLLLNDTPIATIILDEKTAVEGSIRAKLPASAANLGARNRLTVEVTPIATQGTCDQGQYRDFWFISKSNSKISLDHSENKDTAFDLAYYPNPFNNRPSLADLMFVIPDEPTPEDWNIALRLAAALGDSASGQTILPSVVLGGKIPEQKLEDYNLVVIGRPTRNSLIGKLNPKLPQPFMPDSDEIDQRLDDVIFRLPPDLGLGYLQLLPSPWNSERAVIVVTGTTDETTMRAAQLLTTNRFKRLKGNLILVQESKVESIDTRKLLPGGVAMMIATAVPELITETVAITNTPTPAIEPSTTPNAAVAGTPRDSAARNNARWPNWLIPLIVAMVLIVLAILAVAFMQAQRRRKHA